MNYRKSRSAIATVVTLVVVLIIVTAVGVGGYYAFDLNRAADSTSTSSILSTTSSTTVPSTTSESSSTTSIMTTSTSSSSQTSTEFSTSTYSSTETRSTSSTSLSSTSESLSSTTSSVSNACSTTVTSNQSSVSDPFTSGFVNDLLGNFSQMSMRTFSKISIPMNSSFTNETSLSTDSYAVVGRPIINGSQFTLVNYTEDISVNATQYQGQSTINQSGTVYFDAQGNATRLTSGTTVYTGELASVEALALMLPFELTILFPYIFSILPANSPALQVINQTSITIGGNLTMDVTNYNITVSSLASAVDSSPLSNCGSTSIPLLSQNNYTESLIVQMGKLPMSSTSIMTFLDLKLSSPTLVEASTFQLMSIRLAPGYNATTTQTSSTTTRTTSLTSV